MDDKTVKPKGFILADQELHARVLAHVDPGTPVVIKGVDFTKGGSVEIRHRVKR